MPQVPKIAVIGAGPAGLTLANLLQRHGWPVTVLESDATPDSRDQGGTLDLHSDGGQIALEKAGLLSDFLSLARSEDQETRIVDTATGAILHADLPEPEEGDRPEIDRIALRRLLLRPLAEGTVLWGARVEKIVPLGSDRYDIRLADRRHGPFDLIVGADGAWSKVRAALSPVHPAYTGVTYVELWLSDVDRRHPALAGLVGHGSLFALKNGAGIFAQRNGGGTIRVYAAFRTQAEEGERTDRVLAGITVEDILKRFPGWTSALTELVAEADMITAIRPICTLPPDFRWPHRPGLTLLGDAAHVMAPMGAGVNLAMLDAVDLAEALTAGPDRHAAVAAFETAMTERAAAIARETASGFAEWFSAQGAQALLDHMARHADGPEAG